MIRKSIAFVDDHPIFLEGLSSVFLSSGYDVVGKGKTADDAVRISADTQPDILVTDVNMPGNVFEAIARVSAITPGTKIIVFTASDVIDHALRAIEAGAKGYVLKGCTSDELREAIDRVMEGETFITPCFAAKVIASLRTPAVRAAKPAPAVLSLREDQILKFLLRGSTNKEIAHNLHISEKTVKHYMTLLMQKMHARNRLGVVIAAQKLVEDMQRATSASRRPELHS